MSLNSLSKRTKSRLRVLLPTAVLTATLLSIVFGTGFGPLDWTRAEGLLYPKPRAEVFKSNVFIPWESFVFVPCANGGLGEDVHLTGTLHVLTTFVEDASDDIPGFHSQSQSQPQGVSGLGLVTGDTYRATGMLRSSLNATAPGSLAFEQTFVNNFQFIGLGQGNNFLIHQTFHLTRNANGDVSAFIENFTVECK